MFGIGGTEIIVILVVALIVIGPAKLPEVARTLGKAMGEFRRVSDDVKHTIESEMDKDEEKQQSAEVKKEMEQKEKDVSGETEKNVTDISGKGESPSEGGGEKHAADANVKSEGSDSNV